MEVPSLTLLPPTPVRPALLQAQQAESSSRRTSRPISLAQESSAGPSVDQGRSSSETTIFTIYSMYGDGARGSWSVSDDTDVNLKPDISNGSVDDRSSFPMPSRYTAVDYAAFEAMAGHRKLSAIESRATLNGSAHLAVAQDIRLASQSDDGSAAPEVPETVRSSSDHTYRQSMVSSATSTPSAPTSQDSHSHSHPRPPRSRQPSLNRKSGASNGDTNGFTPPASPRVRSRSHSRHDELPPLPTKSPSPQPPMHSDTMPPAPSPTPPPRVPSRQSRKSGHGDMSPLLAALQLGRPRSPPQIPLPTVPYQGNPGSQSHNSVVALGDSSLTSRPPPQSFPLPHSPPDSRSQSRNSGVIDGGFLASRPSSFFNPTPTPSRPPSQAASSQLHHYRRPSSNGGTTPTPRSPPKPAPTKLPSPPQSAKTPQFLRNMTSFHAPSTRGSVLPVEASEGEEPDAFHVRNTYATLELYGVKGDGYEDGVERTRAKVGSSRESQLDASQALGDGTEKTKELNPKEIATLASLDRYGFFTVPSHDRLVLLSSAPLLKRLARIPSTGPKNAPIHGTSLQTLPPIPLPIKEASRISKWSRMMQPISRDEGGNVEFWGVKSSKEGKLRERAYKGIPDRWRGAAWELMMQRFSKTGKVEMMRLQNEFRDALEKPSTYDVQIDLDVPRTITGHVMFRTRYGAGQRSLFHVLHCFSLCCSTCGYVQGMGPIAATLLCYFDPAKVYASLTILHDAYAMHSIFSPGFPGLLETIYVQERITELMMPDVYAAFKKHMISTTSYATKWYITLFANSVPFQTQLRLWDVFLLEGQDLYVAVAIAIVWAFKDQITSAAANFETILSLISSFFVPEDEDTLLSWIEKTLGDKKLRANMTSWREEWKALVKSGKDGDALL